MLNARSISLWCTIDGVHAARSTDCGVGRLAGNSNRRIRFQSWIRRSQTRLFTREGFRGKMLVTYFCRIIKIKIGGLSGEKQGTENGRLLSVKLGSSRIYFPRSSYRNSSHSLLLSYFSLALSFSLSHAPRVLHRAINIDYVLYFHDTFR